MQKLVSNTPYNECVYSESGVANLMLSKLLGLELEEAASGMVSTSEGGVAAAVAAFCDLSWAARAPAPIIPMESAGGPFRRKAENRGLVVDVFSGGEAPPSAGALRRLVIRILMGIGRRTGSWERPGGLAAGSSTGAAKDSSLTRARDNGDLHHVVPTYGVSSPNWRIVALCLRLRRWFLYRREIVQSIAVLRSKLKALTATIKFNFSVC